MSNVQGVAGIKGMQMELRTTPQNNDPPTDLQGMRRMLVGSRVKFEEEATEKGGIEIRVFHPCSPYHVVFEFDQATRKLLSVRAWE